MTRCMKCAAELYIRPKCLICGWEATVPVDRALPDVSSSVWIAWGRTRAKGPRRDIESARQGIPAWSLRLSAMEIAARSRHASVADRLS